MGLPRNSATTCSSVGSPTQRGVGDEQDILAFAHNKRDVRGQIREQFAAGIIGINFHGVGDHILRHGGVEPYFAHFPGKDLAGVSIHREGDRLARFDPADIRFIDRDPNLETIQVLGEQKEAGGIEAGHHRLADVDPPVDDDPFDRRDLMVQ